MQKYGSKNGEKVGPSHTNFAHGLIFAHDVFWRTTLFFAHYYFIAGEKKRGRERPKQKTDQARAGFGYGCRGTMNTYLVHQLYMEWGIFAHFFRTLTFALFFPRAVFAQVQKEEGKKGANVGPSSSRLCPTERRRASGQPQVSPDGFQVPDFSFFREGECEGR